jgi:hypothetical protein
MVKRSALALVLVAVGACSGTTGPTGSTGVPASSSPPSPSPIASTTPASSESPESAAPTEAPTSPSGSAAAGPPGLSFVDPEGDYRITIPDDWEARHGAFAQGIEVWLVAEVADAFGPNVNVLTQAVGDMTLDEYTEMSIATAPNLVKDFEVQDSRTEVAPSGTELAVLEYSGEAGADRPLRFLAVWTVRDGKAIVATFTSTPEAYAEQRDAILPYLLTLEPL